MFGWVFIENMDGKIQNSKFKKRVVGRIGSTVRFDWFTGSNWFDLMVRIGLVKWFKLVQLNGLNWFSSVHRCGSGFLNQFSGSSIRIESVQWFGSSSNIFFLNQPEPAKHTSLSRFKLNCWPVRNFSNRFAVRI